MIIHLFMETYHITSLYPCFWLISCSLKKCYSYIGQCLLIQWTNLQCYMGDFVITDMPFISIKSSYIILHEKQVYRVMLNSRSCLLFSSVWCSNDHFYVTSLLAFNWMWSDISANTWQHWNRKYVHMYKML